MHHYRIYGLDLLSDRALPGVMGAECDGFQPDLVVRWVGDGKVFPTRELPWRKVATPELDRRRRVRLWRADGPDGLHLWLQYRTRIGRLDFLLGPGVQTLSVYWPSSVSFSDVQSYFVGPVFACLLRRRGTLCLHASVVAHRGSALAIIGDKGTGKSTTAAALVRDGWRMLADDVGALCFDPERILVSPGYPRMRLTPDVARELFGDQRKLSPVYSHEDKQYLHLDAEAPCGGFLPRSVPLAGIFFLGSRLPNGEPNAEPIGARPGLISLAKNTIGNYVVIDATAKARELGQMSSLVKTVPMHRLSCPEGIDALPAVSAFLRRGLGDSGEPWLS